MSQTGMSISSIMKNRGGDRHNRLAVYIFIGLVNISWGFKNLILSKLSLLLNLNAGRL